MDLEYNLKDSINEDIRLFLEIYSEIDRIPSSSIKFLKNSLIIFMEKAF